MEDDALGSTHPDFVQYLQEVVNLHEEFDIFRLHMQYRKEANKRGKFKDVEEKCFSSTENSPVSTILDEN